MKTTTYFFILCWLTRLSGICQTTSASYWPNENTNIAGSGCAGFGTLSLVSNVSGADNTALGLGALRTNSTGVQNTAVGYHALFSNNNAAGCTAIGWKVLYNNNVAAVAGDGLGNTGIGHSALYNNLTGEYNTADGVFALINNTSGYWNTAVGYNTLGGNTGGTFNTGIGYSADITSSNVYNSCAIGNGAVVTTANEIRMGDAAVGNVVSQNGWFTNSDGRFKFNITESVKGLEFILKLRPVVYNFDTKGLQQHMIRNFPPEAQARFLENDFASSTAKRVSGFIAQEVEKTAKECGFDFSAVLAPNNEESAYSLNYELFAVPLVKAVQEQQSIIDEFQTLNQTLKSQLELNRELLSQTAFQSQDDSEQTGIPLSVTFGDNGAQLTCNCDGNLTVRLYDSEGMQLIVTEINRTTKSFEVSGLNTDVISYIALEIDSQIVGWKKL